MVKMSRRDRQSAILKIRCWSTEQLQKFLTDVSCTSRTLCRDVSLLSNEMSGFVLFMNVMACRVKTVIPKFTVLIRSSKTARRSKFSQQKNQTPNTSHVENYGLFQSSKISSQKCTVHVSTPQSRTLVREKYFQWPVAVFK